MKKFFKIFFALLLVFTLVGCAKENNTKEKTKPLKAGNLEIEIPEKASILDQGENVKIFNLTDENGQKILGGAIRFLPKEMASKEDMLKVVNPENSAKVEKAEDLPFEGIYVKSVKEDDNQEDYIIEDDKNVYVLTVTYRESSSQIENILKSAKLLEN